MQTHEHPSQKMCSNRVDKRRISWQELHHAGQNTLNCSIRQPPVYATVTNLLDIQPALTIVDVFGRYVGKMFKPWPPRNLGHAVEKALGD
jgi:hypothetical protein